MGGLLLFLLACAPPHVRDLPPPAAPSVHVVPSQARALYLSAQIHLSRDQLDLAGQDLDAALRLDPQSPWIRLAWSEVALRRGDLDTARAVLGEATQVDPGVWQAWLSLARLDRIVGEQRSAVEEYRRAVEAGGSWAARAGQVDMLVELGRAEEAQDALSAWAVVFTDDPYELAERGARRLAVQDAWGAFDDLCTALELLPDTEALLDRFIQAARDSRRYESALVELERLSVASPSQISLVQRVYGLSRDVGDSVRALRAVDQLIQRVGADDPGLHLDRGRLLVQMGEPGLALVEARSMPEWPGRLEVEAQALGDLGPADEALALLGEPKPGEPVSVVRLRLELAQQVGLPSATWLAQAPDRVAVDALLALGDLDGARARAGALEPVEWAALLRSRGFPTQALALLDGLPQAPGLARARVLLDLGRPREALPLLQGASQVERHLRAVALEAAGDSTQAFAVMQELAASSPEYAPALGYVGYALALQGRDLERALRLTRRALDIQPGDGHYRDSVGFVLLQLGRAPEALIVFERALLYLPDDPVLQAHWAAAQSAAQAASEAP